MATLDQLPAEQRAIVELVVQRGRSYATLADVLQVPSERVRELARDALTELSPRTAQRVEERWRGQIADYLLGQQSDGDARLTRDYLKRSETGRAWALSLLDSLDPLYPNGAVPPVPDPDAEPAAAAEAEAPAEPEREPEAAPTLEDRVRERAQKQSTKEEPAAAEVDDEPAEPSAERKPLRSRPGELSPEAESALRRRRILGAVGGLVVLVGIVLGILAIAGAFSGDDDNGATASSTTGTTSTTGTSTTGTSTTGGQPIQVLGQIPLSPIGKTKAQGVAYVVQQGSQKFVVVQAQVPPLPNSQKVAAYEVWLYNTNSDARSLGAQYTDKQGILQGRAELPGDYAKFKSVDVSRELFSDKNAGHGKASVLRGNFADLKPVPQQQQGGAGTSTTPGG
jgi:Sigma-70, region 4